MEDKLRQIIQSNLEVVLEFDPYGRFDDVSSVEDFIGLISRDPAFAPFHIATEKYAIARVGGNIVTSLHRKLGDIYEGLFSAILSDQLGIPESDLDFKVSLDIDGEIQQRSTDGLVRYKSLSSKNRKVAKSLAKTGSTIGMGFEVRSCYQIGDSKRIQADRDLALALARADIEPVMLIFCTTSLESPVRRLSEHWSLYEGEDSFEFIKELTGFDLFGFLRSEEKLIQGLIERIMNIM